MARGLLELRIVDRGVLATAEELLACRQYPGAVAVCSDALDAEPEYVPLLVLRARGHIALRRDLDAQADLRDAIRLDPSCGAAFRLLGVLAARRDEHRSAAIFFREALRLDARDREAADWLAIVEPTLRSAAAARQHPAPAAAADRSRSSAVPTAPPRPTRFARGTHALDEDRPTQRFPRAPQPEVASAPAPRPRSQIPEAPGFGDYLVSAGILTRDRLRAAQAYQRSMNVQLATAVVTLGLASPQRVEWAAVAHQSQVAREKRAL